MALILLGLLVILGLLVYMLLTGELRLLELFGLGKTRRKPPKEEREPAKVIILPTDMEKEKKKRHVKTGKD